MRWKNILSRHYIRRMGNYRLIFRTISTNSANRQGISLFFSDFKGSIALNGCDMPVLKGPFKHYTFKVDELENGEFTLDVQAESGSIFFGNASERSEIGLFTCGAFANAFWIEQTAENVLRFHCNDHEFDDDFDDLIFDMQIIA